MCSGRGAIRRARQSGLSRWRVLSDSVFRFKGQSAPCVILTEVDFASFDESPQRLLFVGATRATMKLFVVMSEQAAVVLLKLV